MPTVRHVPFAIRRFATLLALSLCVIGVVSPARAHADDVSTAQARVDALLHRVASTTRTLTEGTRAWEQDRLALIAVSSRLARTRAQVAAAKRVADANSRALRDLARRLWMSPSPNHFELAVTRGPDEFTEAVRSLGSLNLLAASRNEVVRRATVARAELESQEHVAAALANRARQLEQRSALRMRGLQSLAQATAIELSSAQRGLVLAREAEAARIAAAEHAAQQRLAQAQQIREQARAERAASAPFVSTCQGLPIEGQQNGFLDPGSLCPLWQAPGMSLRETASAAFNAMSRFHLADAGSPLCVTGGYRTYQRQVELYAEKPGLAAVPGNSEHGWGNAADLCGGVQDSGSPAHQWMQVHAADFGWFHPAWAEPTGSRPEAWHWEFNG